MAAIPSAQRAAALGQGWQQSGDRAWTTAGDETGLHLLVADAADGYAWRTAATLAEPGLDTDRWIGNACVTASGRRAVVAYAPRTFVNRGVLFDRGAFTAVVDLDSGAVRRLPFRSSLAYFNPGCGTSEDAVVTQAGDEDLGRTRLLRVDAVTGAVRERVETPGQVTSALPTRDGIVGAVAGAVVRIRPTGGREILARVQGTPFKLAADADGGLVFLTSAATATAAGASSGTTVARLTAGPGSAAAARQQAVVHRLAPAVAGTGGRELGTLATGPLQATDVASGAGGRVFVTGLPAGARLAGAPGSVSAPAVPAGSRVSLRGALAVTAVQPSGTPGLLGVEATATATGRTVRFEAPVAATRAPAVAPLLAEANSDGANNPADPTSSVCAVPRNDPANQVYQPRAAELEWAVDQAVHGKLTLSRAANWKQQGMPAYSPQELFPPRTLAGGGTVPAQVLLAVAMQESSMHQASTTAMPGVTGNPLVGSFYGISFSDSTTDDWSIHWDKADCGYGVTQVTDHMVKAARDTSGQPWAYQTQRAVALDYAANIAAGLQILQDKWNAVAGAGMKVNDGDSSKIENWFLAVWAYNSGFYAKGDGSAPWGVGWLNNPANPRYAANRAPFLEKSGDGAHPGDWSYPELIMGWAAHSGPVLDRPNVNVTGFTPARWNSTGSQLAATPPTTAFCGEGNNCEPGKEYPPDVAGEKAGPCAHKDANGKYDLKCWFHGQVTWKSDCATTCGAEVLAYPVGSAAPSEATNYPPLCTLTGLPSGALIVDDVPDTAPIARTPCTRTWKNAGTFQFTFVKDSVGEYRGKADTHQLGAGFGAHLWFAHARTATDKGGLLTVTGNWKLSSSRTGSMQVLIALPDHAAHTTKANYVIKTASGNVTKVVSQVGTGNRWLSLGYYTFKGVPEVSLSNVNSDPTDTAKGDHDVAFDAVAFVPVSSN